MSTASIVALVALGAFILAWAAVAILYELAVEMGITNSYVARQMVSFLGFFLVVSGATTLVFGMVVLVE